MRKSAGHAIVGETNDGYLNDIRARRGTVALASDAIGAARGGASRRERSGPAGHGAFGFKGGIGTSSRVLPQSLGGYTVGVLVHPIMAAC